MAEARARTVDPFARGPLGRFGGLDVASYLEWRHPVALPATAFIERDFLGLLRRGDLVATGRIEGPRPERRLIDPSDWSLLQSIDWDNSSAIEERAQGMTLLDVLVFPPLLAPNRVDLLAGKPLADVCRQYLLNESEVGTLALEALRVCPDFKRVFEGGRCYVHGVEEWPLAFDRWSMLCTVHPNPALRSILDGDRPDPIEVVIAAEALKHRYRLLIRMLRDRELDARGLPAQPGERSEILVSIWSHEDFHLHMLRGDVLQTNFEATDQYDRLTRRWLGVVLERGSTAQRNADSTFHVKPTPHHGLRSVPTDTHDDLPYSPKAISRLETTGAARKACVEWLVGLMAANPSERIEIAELWRQARQKWPRALSERAFLEARSEAIRMTGAAAWAAGGAPKKKHLTKSAR